MLKVLSIFGTRPEGIKMAPIVKALEQQPDKIKSVVCVTGQHREMLDQVLQLFGIVPDYDLDVMKPGQTPTGVAASIFSSLEPILKSEEPDWVLVQGDTTTVMTAAIAASYGRVKVGHVEAGLRTYNKQQPFPEEINRRVVGVIADRHFAPTSTSKGNLLSEKTPPEDVLVTGNSVIDALYYVADLNYDLSTGPLSAVNWDKRIILVTAHRRENFGEPLDEICQALVEIAKRYENDVELVYPVHLNPNVQRAAKQWLADVPNIKLLPPLDYLPLVHLMKNAELVLTDSGGIQEEAPGLGKPVLVLRETTERPEAVDAGTVKLVGADQALIIEMTTRLLDDKVFYDSMAQAVNPYGDGKTAERIVNSLLNIEVEDWTP